MTRLRLAPPTFVRKMVGGHTGIASGGLKNGRPQMEPIALAPRDAFAAIGIGITKGYELIAAGELEAFKIGKATRITTASIRSYVERQLVREAA